MTSRAECRFRGPAFTRHPVAACLPAKATLRSAAPNGAQGQKLNCNCKQRKEKREKHHCLATMLINLRSFTVENSGAARKMRISAGLQNFHVRKEVIAPKGAMTCGAGLHFLWVISNQKANSQCEFERPNGRQGDSPAGEAKPPHANKKGKKSWLDRRILNASDRNQWVRYPPSTG